MANRFDVMGRLCRFTYRAVLLIACGLSQVAWATVTQAAGTVVDFETRAPLANAYVLAAYHQPNVVQGVERNSFCVKTLGMYTGSDGRFAFPLERMDGYSPYVFWAIAPGHYLGIVRSADGRAWLKRAPQDYVDMQVVMRKQDPNRPDYRYTSFADEYCDHAASPRDGEAGTEFLRLEVKEMVRYGASAEVIEKIRATIGEREAREGTNK